MGARSEVQRGFLRRLAGSLDRAGIDYRGILLRHITGAHSVLDVGCGTGAALTRVALNANVVGVDPFLPYLLQVDKSRYSQVLQGAAIFLPFKDNSFDVAMGISVLEHLPRADGDRLLSELERVATAKVILLTPNGFFPQASRDSNAGQVHLSGWTPRDLRSRGYRVFGTGGIRGIRGEYGIPRFSPTTLWNAVSRASQPLAQGIPSIAHEILCVKILSKASADNLIQTEQPDHKAQ